MRYSKSRRCPLLFQNISHGVKAKFSFRKRQFTVTHESDQIKSSTSLLINVLSPWKPRCTRCSNDKKVINWTKRVSVTIYAIEFYVITLASAIGAVGERACKHPRLRCVWNNNSDKRNAIVAVIMLLFVSFLLEMNPSIVRPVERAGLNSK